MVKATLQIFLSGFTFSLAGFCTFPCRQKRSKYYFLKCFPRKHFAPKSKQMCTEGVIIPLY